MDYTVHVSNTLWRIKNRLSNSSSCSDNALRLLVLVKGKSYWGLQVTFSFSIWGCVLKGRFERGVIWRAKSRLKGIEDFNLEHCLWGKVCSVKSGWGNKQTHNSKWIFKQSCNLDLRKPRVEKIPSSHPPCCKVLAPQQFQWPACDHSPCWAMTNLRLDFFHISDMGFSVSAFSESWMQSCSSLWVWKR